MVLLKVHPWIEGRGLEWIRKTGLDVVTEWVIDDDITYVVDYEADSIIDGFNKGYELIMEYIRELET
jgi:hypothetical protein